MRVQAAAGARCAARHARPRGREPTVGRKAKRVGILVLLLGAAGAGGALALSHEAPCADTAAQGPSASETTGARVYRYHCYGGPEVLRLEAIATPTPADTEVLVRVRAASVNPLDWHYLRGKPYVMRVESGIGAPKEKRIGADFAGTVEAVGKRVTQFKVGDRVFGSRTGAFATHVVVREGGTIAHMPDSASFAQAAAVGVAATTALQAIRDQAQVREGQRVIINGASGGVGTYAVQIAKIYGAQVTAVASTRNLAMVQELGADRVIDYTTTDFTTGAERYDVIVDMVGNHGARALDAVLAPGGRVVMVGGPNGNAYLGPITHLALAMVQAPVLSGTFIPFISASNKTDLMTLRDWMQRGALRSVIDREYAFAELAAAVAYQEAGRSRGKVIVQMPMP
ncbi:MAG: NAD(P)-dependent alcohol dehydrogenase [Gemmatimonas sp.]|nr:NAD(P)-dependent alcohol dehydrogenase [Gemmatimonas sp.]